MNIQSVLEFFNKILPSCETETHMKCMRQLQVNIMKQYGLNNTSEATLCMDQSVRIHEDYLNAKAQVNKPSLSNDHSQLFWQEAASYRDHMEEQAAYWAGHPLNHNPHDLK